MDRFGGRRDITDIYRKYNGNIVENGVKHHTINQKSIHFNGMCGLKIPECMRLSNFQGVHCVKYLSVLAVKALNSLYIKYMQAYKYYTLLMLGT